MRPEGTALARTPLLSGPLAATTASPALAGAVLAAALAVETWLLAGLVRGAAATLPATTWLALHLLASAAAAAALAGLLAGPLAGACPSRAGRLFALCLALGASLPLVGSLGAAAALGWGFSRSNGRHREPRYWRFTDRARLPYAVPRGRMLAEPDGRGIAERLLHDEDGEALYRQVLAAGRMPSALSVDALVTAIAHPDERIRLTAYQTLDRKVSRLNDEIQRLEAAAATREGRERSDTWLQIASNYWELLTLEQGEPIAREQLLGKAETAALRAIVTRSDNRNAHFTLGRISLRQGRPERARVAFERAAALGMPEETTLPYLAEAAFDERRFERIGEILGRVHEAFLAYPPLRQVAERWR